MSAPWEMHPYQYVNQNPILFWDPDGKAGRLIIANRKSIWIVRGRRIIESKTKESLIRDLEKKLNLMSFDDIKIDRKSGEIKIAERAKIAGKEKSARFDGTLALRDILNKDGKEVRFHIADTNAALNGGGGTQRISRITGEFYGPGGGAENDLFLSLTPKIRVKEVDGKTRQQKVLNSWAHEFGHVLRYLKGLGVPNALTGEDGDGNEIAVDECDASGIKCTNMTTAGKNASNRAKSSTRNFGEGIWRKKTFQKQRSVY